MEALLRVAPAVMLLPMKSRFMLPFRESFSELLAVIGEAFVVKVSPVFHASSAFVGRNNVQRESNRVMVFFMMVVFVL